MHQTIHGVGRIFSRIYNTSQRIFRTMRKAPNIFYTIFLLCVFVFAACSGILVYRLIILPQQSNSAAAEARFLYHSPAGTSSSSAAPISTASKAPKLPSFAELKAINPDIEGWITISGTSVDYPVLRAPASSPDYYLTHDWKHRETKYGSIYLYPPTAKTSTEQKNSILYGHSMKDGQMFADLLQYSSLVYYRLHPVIQYQVGNDKASYKIFAVIKANTDPSQGQLFDYQKSNFSTTNDFLKYLYEVRIRSLVQMPVDLKASDKILTLSTCSYEFDGFRTVVFARRVRKDESANTDITYAVINPTPLYPDCWYKKFGGEKPSLPNFEEALKSNRTK